MFVCLSFFVSKRRLQVTISRVAPKLVIEIWLAHTTSFYKHADSMCPRHNASYHHHYMSDGSFAGWFHSLSETCNNLETSYCDGATHGTDDGGWARAFIMMIYEVTLRPVSRSALSNMCVCVCVAPLPSSPSSNGTIGTP